MLDCQYGRSISELSDRFDVSQRTIYRYFDTFKNVGFVLNNNDGYFKINKDESSARDISDLLHFTEEESLILSKAIHSLDSKSDQKDKLVKKLYSLYDFDRVVHAITRKEETDKVYILIQAIKKQKQVVLRGYKSNNSNEILDRIVEPIDFTDNYNNVWCFDTKDNQNKIFIYDDPKKAIKGADVVFSDKVISINDKVNKKKKLSHFKKFRIDRKLMSFAKTNCIFLHCLPRGNEVDEEVFTSKQSKVWQQAMNRVHVQKSILLYCLGKLR